MLSDELRVGDKVLIKHPPGIKSFYTPAWCEGWRGRVLRLNKGSVTVEFEVNEPNRPTIRRYIDYQDVRPIGD